MATITPLAFLGGAGMIVVAIGYLVYVARRRLSGKYLALGALAWVVTVAVKFAWAIPLNPPIYHAITGALPGLPGTLVSSLYVGSLTGFTEVLLTWLLLRYTRLGRALWTKVLAFGIGFGVIEALLLGFTNIATMTSAVLTPAAFPAESMQTVLNQNNPLWGLAPIVERIFTILIHIGSCVLIFLAAARQRSGWMWLAFLFKTLIDSIAAYAQLTGISSLAILWTLEAVVIVFGIIGWLIIRRVQAVYTPPTASASAEGMQPLPSA
jgi:uncharacterized membrane protein YhfC